MSEKSDSMAPGGRWAELRAVLAWIVSSWRRPAAAEARWQQCSEHGKGAGKPG